MTGALVILIVCVTLMSNPLRWSKESIKARMLTLIPIGTSLEEVISVIEDNSKWKLLYSVRNYGYFCRNGIPYRSAPINDDYAVGVKSIEVYLGEYRAVFATGVTVFYGFDEDSNLVDIAVLKETDSL